MRALLCDFLVLGPFLFLSRMDLAVNLLLGGPLHRIAWRLLRLMTAFLLRLILETGRNFSPALGGLLLPGGFPRAKTVILIAPLDASSIYVDNTNILGGLGYLLCPRTLMIISIDMGTSLEGGGASGGAAKFLRRNQVSLHDDNFT
jgi:hypothetical protein